MDTQEEVTPGWVHPSLVRPTWADPGYLLATNLYRTGLTTTVANATAILVGNNPRRWAIGLSRVQGAASQIRYGPFQNVNSYGISSAGAGFLTWYTVFDYGPMVSQDWYVFSTGVEVLMYHEVIVI